MFQKAIESATQFTRPLHSITRLWNSTNVIPGTATLFFVNSDGWALTCKHVADQVNGARQVSPRFGQFKNERAAIPIGAKRKHALRDLERRYGYTSTSAVELLINLPNCIDGHLELEIRSHPSLDVALLRFRNFDRLTCIIREGADFGSCAA